VKEKRFGSSESENVKERDEYVENAKNVEQKQQETIDDATKNRNLTSSDESENKFMTVDEPHSNGGDKSPRKPGSWSEVQGSSYGKNVGDGDQEGKHDDLHISEDMRQASIDTKATESMNQLEGSHSHLH